MKAERRIKVVDKKTHVGYWIGGFEDESNCNE